MKCVVVGTSEVGKTCLVLVFQENSFPSYTLPKVLDVIDVNVVVDNEVEPVDVWDTAGNDEFEEFRPMLYKEADIFIFCFSINNKDSFDAIWEKWYAEVRRRMPSAPILLVGTKSDLRFVKRQDKGAYVSILDAINLAKKIGAKAYSECSAKVLTNITSVLKQVVKHGRPLWKRPQHTIATIAEFRPIPDVDSIGFLPVPIIEPIFNNDEVPPFPIESLSFSLFSKVLGFLSPIELALCGEVNKHFREISESPELWEAHCQTIDPSFSREESAEPPKLVYQILAHSWINDFTTEPSPPPNL